MVFNGLKAKLGVFAISTMFMPSLVNAQHYTGHEFLEMSQNERKAFYFGAFSSIGHTLSASQKKKQAHCVWSWYFDKPQERIKLLENSMRQYPKTAPTSIIIGFVQKQCGQF